MERSITKKFLRGKFPAYSRTSAPSRDLELSFPPLPVTMLRAIASEVLTDNRNLAAVPHGDLK